MTTPAQNSPAVRNRHVLVIASILLSLSSSRRIGTAEIQQRLTSEGIPVSLRTVQRHLTDLSARVVTESGEVHRIGRYVLMTFAREEAA